VRLLRDRCTGTQELLDRVREQRSVTVQPHGLLGMIDERQHRVADEVDRDSLHGEREVGRQQRGAHALTRLAHSRVGEPDDVVRGQTRRDVDLDGDRLPVDPDERCTANRGKHGDLPLEMDQQSREVVRASRESVAPGYDNAVLCVSSPLVLVLNRCQMSCCCGNANG
jgi:hypothetical protein